MKKYDWFFVVCTLLAICLFIMSDNKWIGFATGWSVSLMLVVLVGRRVQNRQQQLNQKITTDLVEHLLARE